MASPTATSWPIRSRGCGGAARWWRVARRPGGPFQGPLSPASQKHALVILRSLCEWLMRQHYLDSNPWDGVPDRAPVDGRMQIDKALSMQLWERLWDWLEE